MAAHLRGWQGTLLACCPGRYGTLTLWVYLAVATYYCLAYTPHDFQGTRLNHLSVLGPLLPDAGAPRTVLLWCARVCFLAGAALWALGRWVPWSGWLATASFTVVISLVQESYYYTQHQVNVVNMLLILYCGWYHLKREALGEALAAGSLQTSHVFPRWVHLCAVFYIGCTYTTSGCTKLLNHGFGWANGTSLQLWVYRTDPLVPPLKDLIVNHWELAITLQVVVLVAEVFAVFAVAQRHLRFAIGSALLGFHVANELIFGFGFFGNLAALACVFLLAPPASSYGAPEPAAGSTVPATERASD